MAEDRLSRIYSKMKDRGFLDPSYTEDKFRKEMTLEEGRKGFYDDMVKRGAAFPDFETFTARVIYPELDVDAAMEEYTKSLNGTQNNEEQINVQQFDVPDFEPQQTMQITSPADYDIRTRMDDAHKNYEMENKSDLENRPYANMSDEELENTIKSYNEKINGDKKALTDLVTNPTESLIKNETVKNLAQFALKSNPFVSVWDAMSSPVYDMLSGITGEVVNEDFLNKEDKKAYNELAQELYIRRKERGFQAEKDYISNELTAIDEMENAGIGNSTYWSGVRYLYEKAIEMLDAPNRFDESNGFANFVKSIGDNLFDRQVFSIPELVRTFRLNEIVDKLNKGEELEQDEMALMDAFSTLQSAAEIRQADLSRGYKIGQGAAESAPFMVDMLVSHGLAASGKRVFLRQLIKNGKIAEAMKWGRWLGGAEGLAINTEKGAAGGFKNLFGLGKKGMETFGDAKYYGREIPKVLTNAEREEFKAAAKAERNQLIKNYAWREAIETPLQTFAMPSSWNMIYEERLNQNIEHLLDPENAEEFSNMDWVRAMGNAYVETFTERAGGKMVDTAMEKFIPWKAWKHKAGRGYAVNNYIQSPIGETAEEYIGASINYLRSFNPLYSKDKKDENGEKIKDSNDKMREEAEYMFTPEGFLQTFGTVLPMSLGGGAVNTGMTVFRAYRYDHKRDAISKYLVDNGATAEQAEKIVQRMETAKDHKEFENLCTEFVDNMVSLGKSRKEVRKIVNEYASAMFGYQTSVKDFQDQIEKMTPEQKAELAKEFEQMKMMMYKSAHTGEDSDVRKTVDNITNEDGNVYEVTDADGNVGYVKGNVVAEPDLYGNMVFQLDKSDDQVIFVDEKGNGKSVPLGSLKLTGGVFTADEMVEARASQLALQSECEDMFMDGDEVYMVVDGQVAEDAQPSHIVSVNKDGVTFTTAEGSTMTMSHADALQNLRSNHKVDLDKRQAQRDMENEQGVSCEGEWISSDGTHLTITRDGKGGYLANGSDEMQRITEFHAPQDLRDMGYRKVGEDAEQAEVPNTPQVAAQKAEADEKTRQANAVAFVDKHGDGAEKALANNVKFVDAKYSKAEKALAKAKADVENLPSEEILEKFPDAAKDAQMKRDKLAKAQEEFDAIEKFKKDNDAIAAEIASRKAASGVAAPVVEENAAQAVEEPATAQAPTAEKKVPQNGNNASRMQSEEARSSVINANIQKHMQEEADKLGLKVRFINSEEELNRGGSDNAARRLIREGGVVRGYLDVDSGEITIIVPNIPDADTGVEIIFHEAVAHKGIRELLGDQFDSFCDKVFAGMNNNDKINMVAYAYNELNASGRRRLFGDNAPANWKRMDGKQKTKCMNDVALQRMAADEYVAHTAEQFKRVGADQNSFKKKWIMLKEHVKYAFDRLLGRNTTITDDEVVRMIEASRVAMSTGKVYEAREKFDTDQLSKGGNEEKTEDNDMMASVVGSTVGGEMETDGGSVETRFSTSSILSGAGFELERDEKGKPTMPVDANGNVYVTLNGKVFDHEHHVTSSDLMKAKGSALSMMIEDATALKTVGTKKVRDIYEAYASIINMYLDEGYSPDGFGVDALNRQWQWLGETVFRTVATNGDTQYSISMDITRICKKNEAVINAISALQRKVGYGITPSQIMDIYLQSIEDDYQVPCPVCYVFSRYIRNGKFATAAINGMLKYGEHLQGGSDVWTVKQWEEELARLDKIKKDKTIAKAISKASNDVVVIEGEIDDLGRIVKSGKIDELGEKILKGRAKGTLSKADEEKLLDQIRALDERYRHALNVISQQSLTNWIKCFAIHSVGGVNKLYNEKEGGFKPSDFEDFKTNALDLRLTANTMVNYPAIQRLRLSGGATSGKEITQASNNEIGEVVMGLGQSDPQHSINYYQKAAELKDGEYDGETGLSKEQCREEARKTFTKAVAFAKQQSLRGGQRMWSWSDNIERLSPDVAVNLLQLEMLGGALQSYSKQLEGIKLVASMDGYVNGSLMGYGLGYSVVEDDNIVEKDGKLYTARELTHEDKNGKQVVDAVAGSPVVTINGKNYVLRFDDVVGIDPFGKDENGKHYKGLFDLNAELDRAGNILVGMDDIHVMTAMADDRVFFIIPWHASGQSTHILGQMYKYLGVTLGQKDAQDFTKVQEEKSPKVVSARLQKLWRQIENEFGGSRIRCGIEGGIPSGDNGRLSAQQLHYRVLRNAIFDGLISNSANIDKLKLKDLAGYSTILGVSSEEIMSYAAEDKENKEQVAREQKAAKMYQDMLKDAMPKMAIEISNDEFLSQVLDSVDEMVGEYANGKMTGNDKKYIYPYEYWDKKSTYRTADVNGTRYLEYCRRLGYKPKFCGTLSGSKEKDFGNFIGGRVGGSSRGSIFGCKGYWKLLIDRRMYGCDGKFQDLTPTDASAFRPELVDPSETKKEFAVTKVATTAASEHIAEKVLGKENERHGNVVGIVDYDLDMDKAVAIYNKKAKATDTMMSGADAIVLPGETALDVAKRTKESAKGEPIDDDADLRLSLGAPYTGTKNRIAKDIVGILPSGERFVDLFSGGGAMTHAALLSGKYGSVLMNDIRPIGQQLFLDGIDGKYEGYNREISREEFKSIAGTPESLLWSYSNNGRSYQGDRAKSRAARVNALQSLKPMRDNIDASSVDYRDVEIRPGDVVYADIPYDKTDTSAYGKDKFDHKAFYEWAKTRPFPVYVSSYDMPEGFVEIWSKDVQKIKGGKVTEKLFVQEQFAPNGGTRFSVVTPKEDAAYMDAVNRGDMETAAKMVRKAAKKSMPNTKVVDGRGTPKIVFHGANSRRGKTRSPKPFTSFGQSIDGIFFTDNREVAYYFTEGEGASYSSQPYKALVEQYKNSSAKTLVKLLTDVFGAKISKETFRGKTEYCVDLGAVAYSGWVKDIEDAREFFYKQAIEMAEMDQKILDGIGFDYDRWEKDYGKWEINYNVYLNIENPLVLDANGESFIDVNLVDGNNLSAVDVAQYARDHGHDGVIIKNIGETPYDIISTDYIALYPEQIKSAEVATYDDNGNLIPLSERFNDESNDIRFSVAPSNEMVDSFGETFSKWDNNQLGNDVLSLIDELRDTNNNTDKNERIAAILDDAYEDWSEVDMDDAWDMSDEFVDDLRKRLQGEITGVNGAKASHESLLVDISLMDEISESSQNRLREESNAYISKTIAKYVENKDSIDELKKSRDAFFDYAKNALRGQKIAVSKWKKSYWRGDIEYYAHRACWQEENLRAYKIIIDSIDEKISSLIEKGADASSLDDPASIMADLGVSSRNVYAIDDVAKWFYKYNKDEYNRELFDKMLPILKKSGITFKFRSIKGHSGTYATNKVMSFDSGYFGKRFDPKFFAEVIVHESIHACTTYAMFLSEWYNNRSKYRETVRKNLEFAWASTDKKLIEAAKVIDDIFKNMSEDGDIVVMYGGKNAKELVAELANPKFRAVLEKKSLWQRIIDAIYTFINGGKKVDNALDGTYQAFLNMLENYDDRVQDMVAHIGDAHMIDSFSEDGNTRFSVASSVVEDATKSNAKSFSADNIDDDADIRFSIADKKASPAENVAHGVQISDKDVNYTDLILDGKKTIETRFKKIRGIKPGERVAIIRSGKGGKQVVVGYATFGKPIEYKTADDFREDKGKHLVPKGDEYDFKDGEVKYGYPISDVVAEPNPYEVSTVHAGLYKSHEDEDGDVRFSVADQEIKDAESAADYEERMDKYVSQSIKNASVELEDPEQYDEAIRALMEAVGKSEDLNFKYLAKTMNTISKRINSLREVRDLTRAADRLNAKHMRNLAKMFIAKGWADEISRGELGKILTAISKTPTENVEEIKSLYRDLVDALAMAQIRKMRGLWKKMLTPVSKKNQSGVEIAKGIISDKAQVINGVIEYLKGDPTTYAESEAELQAKLQDDSLTAERKHYYENQLSALNIAMQYMRDVASVEQSIRDLENDLFDEKAKLKTITGYKERKAQKEVIESLQESIREQRLCVATGLNELIHQMVAIRKEGNEAYRNWVQAKKDHKSEIIHNAMSDLEGVEPIKFIKRESEQHKKLRKAMENITSPARTFLTELKRFGRVATDGQGYLYDRFAYGLTEASENEWQGKCKAIDMLDAKVRELFEGGKHMTFLKIMDKWADDTIEAGATIGGATSGKETQVTVGQAMYIYMVNKMTDGKMKLRKMGITEEQVDGLVKALNEKDKRFVQLADWMQEEFLPSLRGKYSATYQRIYGCPMPEVKHYVPLKISKTALEQNVDLADAADNQLPSSIVGNIIRRTVNTKAIDIENTNAFELMVEHINTMEHWNAYAEVIQDINTLLSNKTFRNKLEAISTGEFARFRELAQIAVGAYKPSTDLKEVADAIKLIGGAKVSIRLQTALKQLSSMPAFLDEAADRKFLLYFAADLAHPASNIIWCMQNLPLVQKRWKSKNAGDEKLDFSELGRCKTAKAIVNFFQKYGLAANSAVDLLTCCVGARTQYRNKYDMYKSRGYSEEEAQRRARLDAEIFYNETQQSSESMMMSKIQSDKGWLSTMISLYNNSSFAYGRKAVEGGRAIKKLLKGDAKKMIDFQEKKLIRDGLDPQVAHDAAVRDVVHSGIKGLLDIAIFGYGIQFFWNMFGDMYAGVGHILGAMFGGGDPDKEDDYWEKLAWKSAIQPIRGFVFGASLENLWKKIVDEKMYDAQGYNESWIAFMGKQEAPVVQDLANIMDELWKDEDKRDMLKVANLVVRFVASNTLATDTNSMANMMFAFYELVEQSDGKITWQDIYYDWGLFANTPGSQTKLYAMIIRPGETEEDAVARYARYKKYQTYGTLYPFHKKTDEKWEDDGRMDKIWDEVLENNF